MTGFYSVAEHSVLVSTIVPPEHQLCALMHDATEAYCVDVPRPLKRMLPGYAEIEALNWRAIAARFGLPAEMPECVKEADNAVLLAEKEELMGPSLAPWRVPGVPAPVVIACLSPAKAREAFLQRFIDLASPA